MHRVQHRIVHHIGRGVVPPTALGHHRVLRTGRDGVRGIAADELLRKPAFHRRTAPVAGDDSHRDIEGGVQGRGEIPAHGRKTACRHRIRLLPFPLHIVFCLQRTGLGNLHFADLVPPSPRSEQSLDRALHRAAVETGERHLHIGLSAGKPHLADEHVTERHDTVPVGYFDCLRIIASTRRSDGEFPPAVLPGHGGRLLPAPGGFHDDFGRRSGLAPEIHVAVLLKNAMVAKLFGKTDFRRCLKRREKQCGGRHNPCEMFQCHNQ